jgi:hypothetical protein
MALLALVLANLGAISLAAVAVVIAAGFGVSVRRWLSLARRSRIGAQSEDLVRHQLAALEREGWRVRHSLPWRGRGDIDSVAIAPRGLGFAIETKTRRYEDRHLAVLQQQAVWLGDDAEGGAVKAP